MQLFFSFGAVNPHPEPIKVKFDREERLPNFTLIGATGRETEKIGP